MFDSETLRNENSKYVLSNNQSDEFKWHCVYIPKKTITMDKNIVMTKIRGNKYPSYKKKSILRYQGF